MSDEQARHRTTFNGAVQAETAQAILDTVEILKKMGIDINSQTLALTPLVERVEELAWRLMLVEDAASKDGLTGAYNRAAHNAILERALTRLTRNSGYVMLAIADIDNFKRINDAYGHPCGDEVIKAMVNQATDAVRKSDTVARIGGEEIAIIAEAQSLEDLKAIQERLQRALCVFDFRHEAISIEVGSSIGIAITDRPCQEPELYKRADQQLYEIKRSGPKGRLLVEPQWRQPLLAQPHPDA